MKIRILKTKGKQKKERLDWHIYESDLYNLVFVFEKTKEKN